MGSCWMKTNKLTAVVITLDEERNIRRCLESLVPVADEIVVVDSCSTDATESICRQFPVVFVARPWQGYIETKNFANSLSSNDWILSIDADEALSEELQASILAIKSKNIERKVFSMNRLMNYCGKWIHHGGWYPDAKIRIFNRRNVRWIGKKVHETLQIPDGFSTVHLSGDLLHYSFYSEEEHRRQARKFARLSAEEAVEAGRSASAFAGFLHAGWRFVRDYLFKMGFLDGRAGWTICKINSIDNIFEKYRLIRQFSNLHK